MSQVDFEEDDGGLEEFRQQYNDALEDMESKVDAAVLASGQHHCYVFYSNYDGGNNTLPVDNLDLVAHHGKCILFYPYRRFWDWRRRKDGRKFISPVLENPTWLTICVWANRSIKRTGDRSHYFFEGLRLRTPPKLETALRLARQRITLYELRMGS